jgi:hypothetical protein
VSSSGSTCSAGLQTCRAKPTASPLRPAAAVLLIGALPRIVWPSLRDTTFGNYETRFTTRSAAETFRTITKRQSFRRDASRTSLKSLTRSRHAGSHLWPGWTRELPAPDREAVRQRTRSNFAGLQTSERVAYDRSPAAVPVCYDRPSVPHLEVGTCTLRVTAPALSRHAAALRSRGVHRPRKASPGRERGGGHGGEASRSIAPRQHRQLPLCAPGPWRSVSSGPATHLDPPCGSTLRRAAR